MALIKNIFFIFIIGILIGGCKKPEEKIVPGNIPPPDHTISNITKENYINRSYISLLGRKPGDSEFSRGLAILNKNNLSYENRQELLDTIFSQPDYADQLFAIAHINLLNNEDTNEVGFFIGTFQLILLDSNNQGQWEASKMEISRLQDFQRIRFELKSGRINSASMHGRCVNNYIYDQINMGTVNFVVSLWQHFLNRYPTNAELSGATSMVDGIHSVVFLKSGESKKDFLNIFFQSTDYFEGQVRELYLRYLFRQPNSSEMSEETIKYKNSKKFKELQYASGTGILAGAF